MDEFIHFIPNFYQKIIIFSSLSSLHQIDRKKKLNTTKATTMNEYEPQNDDEHGLKIKLYQALLSEQQNEKLRKKMIHKFNRVMQSSNPLTIQHSDHLIRRPIVPSPIDNDNDEENQIEICILSEYESNKIDNEPLKSASGYREWICNGLRRKLKIKKKGLLITALILLIGACLYCASDPFMNYIANCNGRTLLVVLDFNNAHKLAVGKPITLQRNDISNGKKNPVKGEWSVEVKFTSSTGVIVVQNKSNTGKVTESKRLTYSGGSGAWANDRGDLYTVEADIKYLQNI